ncbi:unnamed protein product [Lathyrus sativus]|nr:unnamed protein product [Lathyrus sativus]
MDLNGNGNRNGFLKVADKFKESDVSFVRIFWITHSGQHRSRIIPKKHFYDTVTKNGVALPPVTIVMTSLLEKPAPGSGVGFVGEARVTPDLSTTRTIPWCKQDEMVLGDLNVKPDQAWEHCPREVFRRVSKTLKDEFDLVISAGFEIEFYLLKSITTREGKQEWLEFDSSPYCCSSALDVACPILREIASALHSTGIQVEQLHTETGKGQFELVLKHTICNKAVDNLVYTREIIKAIARKHGLLATFLRKYNLDDVSSGIHAHISLWQNGKNVFMASDESSTYGVSTFGEEFMAGILYHLPSIMSFIAPLPISYDRLQSTIWGSYLFWGNENKEAPLRASSSPGTPDGLKSNFEIKLMDGCANPYLGLSAIIAAGIDGLRRHLTLPEPVDTSPNLETLKRLPKSLSESLEALHKAYFLEEFFGDKLLTAIKAIQKVEIDHYSKNKVAYKELIHRY